MFKKSKNRFIEIDLFRGIAVSGMIFYHFFFIGNFYGFFYINFKTLPWLICARIIQFIFLGLVGVSLAISRQRNPSKDGTYSFYKKQFRRFLTVAICALAVTFSTYIFIPERVIVWGVLHLIAFSILTLQFFAKRPLAALVFGLFAMIFGFVIGHMGAEEYLIFNILGFNVAGFYALDYFPIFPWISVISFGIVVGNLLYKNGNSVYQNKLTIFKSSRIEKNPIGKIFLFIGKNALFFYMTHFVVLIGIFELLKLISSSFL